MSRRVRFFSAALVAAGLAFSTPAEAQTFSRTTHTGLFHPLAADFNGDGRMDIAGTTFPGTNAGVLMNNGSGGFAAMATYPVGGDAMTIAGGDLNGDERPDLVVTINQPDIGLALLMNNGDGTFAAPVHLPNTAVADSPSVVVTDLDNDGFQDIAVAHSFNCYGSGCVHSVKMSVLMGHGDGTFEPSRDFDVGQGMAKIEVGDFNKDGIKDLVIGASTARLYRLQGVGDGTFTQLDFLTLDPSPSFIEITDVDAADFNRDGNLDLVAPLSTNSSRLAVLIGNGDGSFAAPLIMQEALDVPQFVAVADYNGDGFEDLAYGFANGNSGLFAIRNGNGNGTFQASRRYEVPPNQSSIGTVGMITAHFNADTKPDLALAIGGAFPAHWVLLNTTGNAPPPTPGTPTLLSPAAGATVTPPFTFDWTDVANAVRYRIQIDDESNFATPLFDRETSLSEFPAPTLNPRRHWWRVRAINSAGVAGSYSASRRFTIGTAPPVTLAAPTLLSPANGATVAQPLTLDWADLEGAVNYRVQIDDSSNFTSPLTVDQTVFGSQFTAPTLPTRQHWWRVRGTNSAGTAGPFSVVRSFTPTALPPPAAPTLRTPVNGATPAQPIAFDWDAVAGATNYRIQIDDSSNFASPVVDTTNEASAFTAPTLALTQHWWRVLALNSAGTAGPFSVVWSFTPQGAATASLSGLFVSPVSVVGPAASTGTATLTAPAPSGGAAVTLSSSNPAVASVPASVTVAAGATSANFTVSTSAVGANSNVTLTGTYDGTSRSATLTVTPAPQPPPAASLNSLALNPASVTGGASSQGTVTLTGAAPSGGAVVTLSSSNTAVANVPASVTVASGATSATFTATTTAPATSTAAAISAALAGVTRTANLTVNPPGGTATLTVTASGRGGERVLSSPAGINVAVGSSQSASFTTGTSITMSATNGRDVIWSGACSSGGDKRRTCTFTFNGAGSISANVQ